MEVTMGYDELVGEEGGWVTMDRNVEVV